MKFSLFKKAIYTPIMAYLSLELLKSMKNKKVIYLTSQRKYKTSYDDDIKDENISKSKITFADSYLHKELEHHIQNFTHHLDHVMHKEKIVFNFEKNKESDKILAIKAYSNYKMNRELKKISKDLKKIDRILKNYLNVLEGNLHLGSDLDKIGIDIDFNNIIDEIQKINLMKNNLKISLESGCSNPELNTTIMNFIFHEHEEIVMRLLSQMIIFHKNSNEKKNIKNLNENPQNINKIINEVEHLGEKNLSQQSLSNFISHKLKNKISEINLNFIINYCLSKINPTSYDQNESHVYFAKRVLINLLTRKDYFYQDYILEINQRENLREIITDPKDDSHFDYDIIFLSGLNANFSKSWRIPKEEVIHDVNYKHRLDYLLYGHNLERIFPVPSYELWVPPMFENVTFRGKKIRYMVTCAETKFFPHDLHKANIPDFSIDQISEKIYNSLKNAGVGKRPLILICHSMGGLICKRVLNLAKEEKYLLDQVKGVVFFSTPHFGSDIIHTLLEVGLKKYLKHFKTFETTSTEYGLDEEDIHQKLTDLKFTRATTDICMTPKEFFLKEHEIFKNLKLNYICLNETEKTWIKAFRRHVHIVEPESSYLPEADNYLLKGKVHSNLQKFSPDNFEEEGYSLLVNFIRRNFIFEKI
jgi:hypothetical protein